MPSGIKIKELQPVLLHFFQKVIRISLHARCTTESQDTQGEPDLLKYICL